MRANLESIARAANRDTRKTLLDMAGPLTDYEIFHNLVLVATYVEPEVTAGGVIIPQKTIDENRFQGKIGLVLKCGPMAFVDDGAVKFGKIDVKYGDWVMYRPSDGIELFIKDRTGTSNDGISCRLIEDALIKGRVSDPALIY